MHALCTKRECSCDGVVSESGRLLGLSSVRALKVGAHFAVIPHPNGSCHILLPTHGWRTSQSQEEKRKLHRQIPSCLSTQLCLRTRVNLRLAEKKQGNDCYFLSRELNMLTLIQCAKSKGPQKPDLLGDRSVENRRGQSTDCLKSARKLVLSSLIPKFAPFSRIKTPKKGSEIALFVTGD